MDKEKWEYRRQVLVSAVRGAIADLASLKEEFQNLPLLVRRRVLDSFGELERRLDQLPIGRQEARPFLLGNVTRKGGQIEVEVRCFTRKGHAICTFYASSPKAVEAGMDSVLGRIKPLSPQGVRRFLEELEAWKKTVQDFFREVAESLEAEFQTEVFQELEARVALKGLEEA